ncbi:hypothetical protein ACVWXL_005653 [Bradyrhizobium sp. GM22.5]
MGIDVARRARLLDPALLHHHHEIGERDRLELGMGDVNEGDTELLLHPPELLAHLHAELLVEGGQRLIEQKHPRLGDRRARQRHALLLAAGELRRQAIGELRQPHLLDHGIGCAEAIGLGLAADAQCEGDILAHGQMREQRVGLKHHRGASLHRREPDDVLAADHDLAGGRVLVAGDHTQNRGLAAAGRTDEAAIGAIGDLEVDAVDHVADAVKALADARQFDIAAIALHFPAQPFVLLPRFFWISTMLPRLAPITMKETIVVTVPSA